MTEELKECPFCSCTDIGEVTINPRLEPRHRRFKVYCKACQCRTSEHKTRKEARIYWNTRAKPPRQGGEAVAVVTTWHPDSRSYEEQIVKHDTKGSRKSLGAMNAKLRAKVGRLERELATVKQSLTVPLEPTEEMLDVAVSFALNVSLSGEYNWSAYMRDVWKRMVKAAPPSPEAEPVALLRLCRYDFAGVSMTHNLIDRIDAKLADASTEKG